MRAKTGPRELKQRWLELEMLALLKMGRMSTPELEPVPLPTHQGKPHKFFKSFPTSFLVLLFYVLIFCKALHVRKIIFNHLLMIFKDSFPKEGKCQL